MRGSIRYRNGAWRLQVLDATGHRRRWITRTVHEPDTRAGRKIADAALAALVLEVEGRRAPTTTTTVADLLTRWVAHSTPRWAPSTIAGQSTPVGHLTDYLGSRRIDRLTVADIDTAYDAMLADGLTVWTVLHAHRALRTALRHAVRWRLITTNPAADADPPAVPPRRNRAPKDDAVATMLAAITDPDFLAYVVLAAAIGARRGELVALRWTDVDLEGGTVRIYRAVSAGVERQTKTGTERTVRLDPGTVEVLAGHRRRVEAQAAAVGREVDVDGWVFSPAPDASQPWAASTMTHRWAHLRAKVAVEHPEVATIRPHDLRHYHATVLSAAGMSLADIGYRLGHRSPQTTALYAHPDDEAGRRAADIIGAKLHGC